MKKRNPGIRHPLILQTAFLNIQLHIPREPQCVHLGNTTVTPPPTTTEAAPATTTTSKIIPRFTHLDKAAKLISEVSAVIPRWRS